MAITEKKVQREINTDSLDTVCAALAYAMGIDAPKEAAEKNAALAKYIDEVFGGSKADRVVMYNPDAIAQWIYEKYPEFFTHVKANADIEVPLCTVMPSVTPVCFGTMYTGAQPDIHGIREYAKPVIKIETLFDVLIAAGKKPAIVTYEQCSLSRIYRERELDYYHYEEGNISDVNAKVMELILRDEHDFIVIYNGNYDYTMHHNGPESKIALAELLVNDRMFECISKLIASNWQHHNTLVGFAMDHGCHEIDGNCGSHGLATPEDLNIVHLYKGYPKAGD